MTRSRRTTLRDMLEHTRAEVARTRKRLHCLRRQGVESGPEYWELRHHLLRTQTLRDTILSAAERVGYDATGFDPQGRYK